jgi:hypothetical protein
MPATKVATVVVAGLSTASKYVEKFIVECYSNVGLSTYVSTQESMAVWNAGLSRNTQQSLIVFKGLTLGTTYYFRAGVTSPISGTTVWSATYSLVAGSVTGPSAVTYTGVYDATTSGVYFLITPASVPSDIDHYDYIYTLDGSVPASSDVPQGSVSAIGGKLSFFVGGKINDRISTYVRAVNTTQNKQVWTSLGTVAIQAIPNDAIIHQGTSTGVGDSYSYRQFSTTAYSIVSGDILQYDVYIEPTSPEFKAGIDFNYTAPSANFRAAGINDGNGVSAVVTTDLTSYAKGKWYHREFDLTSLAGKTTASWATALEGDTAGNYKARFANIKITNGSTLKATIFATGAVPSTSVWSNGPGENYTSVIVHTADVSTGSINTDQIINDAVTNTKAALTASARDVQKNLFGSPAMQLSGSLSSISGVPVEAWRYRLDAASATDTPEFRNGGEIRICKITGTGGTFVEVGQLKAQSRFYSGATYSIRVLMRKLAADAAPNGNFSIVLRRFDSSGVLISSTTLSTVAGSTVLSTYSLLTCQFVFSTIPGASHYGIFFQSTATNTDIYITQAMLNRGLQISEYTDETYLLDVNQYTVEGVNFIDDGFTGSNGTAITAHYPDTTGWDWVFATGTAATVAINASNKLTFNGLAVTQSAVYYNRFVTPDVIGNGIQVQADCTNTGVSANTFAGVVGRLTGTTTYYEAIIKASNVVELAKTVAGVRTSLGTFTHSTNSATILLLITDTAKQVYVDGVQKITSADNAITFSAGNNRAGLRLGGAATTDHPTLDNYKATYIYNGATGITGGGSGGGGYDPPDHCCVGDTLIATRTGEQTLRSLWQKLSLDEWSDDDDVKTYDFVGKKWFYIRPTAIRAAGVSSTLKACLDNGFLNECSDGHGIFHDLDETMFDRMDNLSLGDLCETVDGKFGLTSLDRIREENVVYKLEIPITHAFVANGILCHNTLK